MAVEQSNTAVPPPSRPANSRKVIPGKTTLKANTEAVEGGFQLVGLGFLLVGWHADAAAVGMHAPKIAPEIAKLAETNESIANGIAWLAESGPYAALIEATVGLGLQLAANHGLVKPERLANAGVVHPDVLAAEMRAKMAEQAAEALRKQKDAEDRLRAAQMDVQASLQASAEARAEAAAPEAPEQ